MVATCGYGGVLAAGCISSTVAVVAPAGDGSVGVEGARMVATCGYGGVLAVGGIALAVAIVAPAGDGSVGVEGA